MAEAGLTEREREIMLSLDWSLLPQSRPVYRGIAEAIKYLRPELDADSAASE
jgi:hypothetical protein